MKFKNKHLDKSEQISEYKSLNMNEYKENLEKILPGENVQWLGGFDTNKGVVIGDPCYFLHSEKDEGNLRYKNTNNGLGLTLNIAGKYFIGMKKYEGEDNYYKDNVSHMFIYKHMIDKKDSNNDNLKVNELEETGTPLETNLLVDSGMMGVIPIEILEDQERGLKRFQKNYGKDWGEYVDKVIENSSDKGLNNVGVNVNNLYSCSSGDGDGVYEISRFNTNEGELYMIPFIYMNEEEDEDEVDDFSEGEVDDFN